MKQFCRNFFTSADNVRAYTVTLPVYTLFDARVPSSFAKAIHECISPANALMSILPAPLFLSKPFWYSFAVVLVSFWSGFGQRLDRLYPDAGCRSCGGPRNQSLYSLLLEVGQIAIYCFPEYCVSNQDKFTPSI